MEPAAQSADTQEEKTFDLVEHPLSTPPLSRASNPNTATLPRRRFRQFTPRMAGFHGGLARHRSYITARVFDVDRRGQHQIPARVSDVDRRGQRQTRQANVDHVSSRLVPHPVHGMIVDLDPSPEPLPQPAQSERARTYRTDHVVSRSPPHQSAQSDRARTQRRRDGGPGTSIAQRRRERRRGPIHELLMEKREGLRLLIQQHVSSLLTEETEEKADSTGANAVELHDAVDELFGDLEEALLLLF